MNGAALAVLLLITLMLAWACVPVMAAQQMVTAIKVGSGGITTKGGSIGLYNVNGTLMWRAVGSTGNQTIGGTLAVTGATTLTGAATLANTLALTGAATLASTLGVTGATTLSSTLNVVGNSTLASLDIGGGSGGSGITFTGAGAATFDSAVIASSTLAVTGAATLSSTLTAKRVVSADEGDGSTTMTVAAYPSGSVITCAAATTAIVLPALTSGVTYTFIMKGATSFTLTGPSACVMCDGQTGAVTNLVWSTTPLYLSITVVSDAANWTVTSYTTAPDSSS